MFERSEFLPILKATILWRESVVAAGSDRQGVRVSFSAYSFVTQQKSKA